MMREIDKNLKFSKIQNIDFKAKPEANDQKISAEANNDENIIKDFSNPTAETLGRSQVNKSDNLENDIAFGISNPKAITNADKFFDIAFQNLQAEGDPEAYEKAAAMTDIFVRKEQLANR